MPEKKPEPLIKVQESGSNFTMEDCEFQMGESERPILETRAEGTRVKGTNVSAENTKETGLWSKLLWRLVIPILVLVIGGLALFWVTGN